MLQSTISYLLGLIDVVAVTAVRLLVPPNIRPVFFSKGWGDIQSAFDEQALLIQYLQSDSLPSHLTLTNDAIEWLSTKEKGPIRIHTGQFLSPYARYLPSESRHCRFYLVEPRNSTKGKKKAIVTMLPATNEMGKGERLSMATTIARDHGWSSIIITAPFYASRKPPQQYMFAIDKVDQILFQSIAIMTEASMLSAYFLKQDPATRVCITGFSFGGAMAGCATAVTSLMTRGFNGPQRLGCVPYVGCTSPVVLSAGILSFTVDYARLKKNSGEDVSPKEELIKQLARYRFGDLAQAVVNQGSFVRFVYAFCMRNDHIIPSQNSERLLSELPLLVNGSANKFRVDRLLGGHSMGFLVKPWFQKWGVIHVVNQLLSEDSAEQRTSLIGNGCCL